MMENPTTLFAYGTLLDKAIQLEIFGKILTGVPDQLSGYVLHQNAVAGSYPDIAISSDARAIVSGRRFRIQPKELTLADEYETELYMRKWVTLCSGVQAWVYMGAATNRKSR